MNNKLLGQIFWKQLSLIKGNKGTDAGVGRWGGREGEEENNEKKTVKNKL